MRSILLITALAFSSAALAQTPIAKDGRVEKIAAPKAGLNAQDSQFIKDLAAGNTFEVKSSELALKNGSSSFVKGFAKDMIADHSAAFEELKVVARKKGKTVSKVLPPKHAAIIKKLSGLRGAAFDAAYQQAQKAGHAETAMKLKKEIQHGHDADVKAYAIKTLPTVQMHAKMLAAKKTMTGKHKM